MASKRETKTQERHADIYAEYLKALEEHKNLAPLYELNKKCLYVQIGEKCRCSSEHVRSVVNKMKKHQES